MGNEKPIVDLGTDMNMCTGTEYILVEEKYDEYLWDDGSILPVRLIKPDEGENTYSITITENNCEAFGSIVITGTPAPVVDIGDDVDIYKSDKETYTLDAGSGFESYLWSDGITTTQTYETDPSKNSEVSVVVTNSEGCIGYDTVNIRFVLGVNSPMQSEFKLYPNPANDKVTLELSNLETTNDVTVILQSIDGRIIQVLKWNGHQSAYTETIDVSALQNGMYIIYIQSKNETRAERLIIMR